MENKCCDNKCCMRMCGCHCCDCEQKVHGLLRLTVGDFGDFKTLREAQHYIRTTACRAAYINIISDVKEEVGDTISITGLEADPPMTIDGNNHTLDLSNIVGDYGMVINEQYLRLKDITVFSSNATFAVLGVGGGGTMQLIENVTIQGGGSAKTSRGVHVCTRACTQTNGTNIYFKDCNTAIDLNTNASVVVLKPLNFTNVTTEFNPAKGTVGNRNSYIAINY